MPPARRSGRVGALAATVVQLATIVSGAATSFVVARELGPHGTGIYAVAGQFVLSMMMFGGLGLRTGIAHEISAGRLSRHAAATEATLLSALLGGLAGAIGFGLYELGSDSVFDGIGAGLAALLCAAAPFAVAWWVLGAIPLAAEDYRTFAILQASPFTLIVIPAIPLALTIGVDGVLIAVASAFILAGVSSGAWALRQGREESAPGWRLAESLRLGLRGWPLEMLQLLAFRPDVLIVAAYGSTADAGVYSLAVTISTIGWILPQALGTVALPRLSSLVAAAGADRARPDLSMQMAERALRHGVLLAIGAGVLVAALLLLAPVIFGSGFDRTVGLGMIMLPGVVALALGRVMIALLLGLGRGNLVLAIGLAVVPAALAAYLLAVPGGGPTAAAIVSGAAYLLTTAGAVIASRRAGLPLNRAALVPRGDELGVYTGGARRLLSGR